LMSKMEIIYVAYACDENTNVCIHACESFPKRRVSCAVLSIGGEIRFFFEKNPKKNSGDRVTVTVTAIKFKKLAPTHPTQFTKVSSFKQLNPPRILKSFL
jgi:hypothetical protein